MAEDVLSVSELLFGVYKQLEVELKGKEIKLPAGSRSLIGDDSDWHRTRQGFMFYDKAMVVQLNGKEWVIAYGKAGGSYPADPYTNDIIAFAYPFSEKKKEEVLTDISRTIRRGEYFQHTLLLGGADGRLAIPHGPDNPFCKSLKRILSEGVGQFTTQKVEYVEGILSLDLRRVPSKSMTYKPEFVPFLVKIFTDVLKAN